MKPPTIRGWAWIIASLSFASLAALAAVSAIALAPHSELVTRATAPILPLYSVATEQESALRSELSAAREWVATGNPEALATLRQLLGHGARPENPLFEAAVPSHYREPLERAESLASTAEAQIALAIADRMAGRSEQARRRLDTASALRRRVGVLMSALVAQSVGEARALHVEAVVSARHARTITLVSALAALALVAGSVALLRLRVIQPGARLYRGVRALAQGDLASRVDVTSDDEIGVVARDVNRLADALDARLRQHDRLAALGELSAGLAHELNNPLQVILAQAGHWDQAGLPSEAKEAMRLIQEHARRARRVVHGLLTFVRAREAEQQPCDVNALVGDTLDLLEHQFRAEQITLQVRRASELPPVVADPGQIEQVLVNLLANARHAAAHAPNHRAIVVETKPDSDTVVVAIEDSGPGVPANLRDRIFDPFFTTKASEGGTGLGLAIASQIAHGHGGTLSLVPGTLGGARFELRLPASPGTPVAPSNGTEAAAAGQDRLDGVSVLVADDEDGVRRTVGRFFTKLGALVTTARDGAEALGLIRERDYDAIVLDLKMPVVSGWEVLLAARRERPELASRIVVLSGDITGLLELATAEHLEPWRVLEKPADLTAIRAAVARAAALRRS